MPADIKMTLDERRKYLLGVRLRYVQANRTERSRLLDEMEQVTDLHRNSLLRLMKDEPVRKPRQRQRGRTHNYEVDDVIRVVAESLDYTYCLTGQSYHTVARCLSKDLTAQRPPAADEARVFQVGFPRAATDRQRSRWTARAILARGVAWFVAVNRGTGLGNAAATR